MKYVEIARINAGTCVCEVRFSEMNVFEREREKQIEKKIQLLPIRCSYDSPSQASPLFPCFVEFHILRIELESKAFVQGFHTQDLSPVL